LKETQHRRLRKEAINQIGLKREEQEIKRSEICAVFQSGKAIRWEAERESIQRRAETEGKPQAGKAAMAFDGSNGGVWLGASQEGE